MYLRSETYRTTESRGKANNISRGTSGRGEDHCRRWYKGGDLGDNLVKLVRFRRDVIKASCEAFCLLGVSGVTSDGTDGLRGSGSASEVA